MNMGNGLCKKAWTGAEETRPDVDEWERTNRTAGIHVRTV